MPFTLLSTVFTFFKSARWAGDSFTSEVLIELTQSKESLCSSGYKQFHVTVRVQIAHSAWRVDDGFG